MQITKPKRSIEVKDSPLNYMGRPEQGRVVLAITDTESGQPATIGIVLDRAELEAVVAAARVILGERGR